MFNICHTHNNIGVDLDVLVNKISEINESQFWSFVLHSKKLVLITTVQSALVVIEHLLLNSAIEMSEELA